MTEPEIPTDDPETRHDPSSVGLLSVLGLLGFVALVYAWTESFLLTVSLTAACGVLGYWSLR
ncbi:hypothetical protein LPA44_02995 [Halobacterium sp. KA-4]|jgi:hypothetical protein|uniref:hypothetical protein n=1 Tax=Halobacterium sp. KA-4 TaxID=2896367 RepID=UPI001E62BD8C|nr:hypothetical protein [Halobacterium sp. KA-4]MCD2198866.1 hypothetical protein [Halobacterium sp. KA-4]